MDKQDKVTKAASHRPDSGLPASPINVQSLILAPHKPTDPKPIYSNPRKFRRASRSKPIKPAEGKRCGSGAFGDVYKITLGGRKEAAIKVFRPQVTQFFSEEVSLLKNFNHPQIIGLIGTMPDEPAIIMPYLNKGSFERFAIEEERDIATVSPLLYNIADALNYLHNKGFVYRDLKLSNVMLNQQGEKLEAVLVDLGSVKKTTNPISDVGTTPIFLAPEVIKQLIQSDKAKGPRPACQTMHDMYAFGLLMLAAINRGEPFEASLSTINLFMITFDKMPALLTADRHSTSDSRHAFFTFAHQCASRRPENRPSASEAMDCLDESPLPAL